MENGTWAPTAGKQMAQQVSAWKDMTVVEPMVSLKSAVKADGLEALKALAAALAETCRE